MAPQAVTQSNLSPHSPLRTHPRDFFAACGRRGGRPRLSEQERHQRAIARLERKLATLKASQPCRTLHIDTSAHTKRRKQRGVSRSSARTIPVLKVSR